MSLDDDPRLFRFGFLVHAANEPPEGAPAWRRLTAGWVTRPIGALVVVHHPEVACAHLGGAGDATLLLGDAFLDEPGGELLARAHAASDDALHELLVRASGRFALVTLRGPRVRVYQDAFGARTIAYRRDGPLAVASHAELVALAWSLPRDEGVAALVASPTFRALQMAVLPGDLTPWRDVLALVPNHALEPGRERLVRFWPRRTRAASTLDAYAHAMDAWYGALARHLHERGARPVVSVTGGIDSRLILAALRARFDGDIRTVTWTRFNFRPWELVPVTAIVRHVGSAHALVDHTNDAIADDARLGDRMSGGVRGPSTIVSGMGRLFGDDPRAVFVRGLGAEVHRGFYNLPGHEPLACYDAAAMCRAFVRRGGLGGGPVDGTFEREVRRAFEGFAARVDTTAADALGFEPSDLFFWEHALGRWASESLNAMDPALVSRFGFDSRRAAELAMGLPPGERLGKGLFAELVRRYDPGLAAIPFR